MSVDAERADRASIESNLDCVSGAGDIVGQSLEIGQNYGRRLVRELHWKAPLVVEADAHQPQTFDDRTVRRRLLQDRRHYTDPLLKQTPVFSGGPSLQFLLREINQQEEANLERSGPEVPDVNDHDFADVG
ncbi:hypothetical protein [Bradyrhizobium sp. CCBAU 53415]|uniref:hypothetical protein n=1 Tax=Bradyrhizobium sp. CCBAU 53415 TaxID=1325119 RepID=UPI0023050E95|nr:hypothetical protein [Bradyrhizobium sp. CCBAU 53415]